MSCVSSGMGSNFAAPRLSMMICVSVDCVRSSPDFASNTCTSSPSRICSAKSASVTYRLFFVS
jgi:hypothetical protein